MSAEATAWVWRFSKSQKNHRLVMLALANWCGSMGSDSCWGTVGTIARRTLLNEKSVRYILADLVASGELLIEPRGADKFLPASQGRAGLRADKFTLPEVGKIFPNLPEVGKNRGTKLGKTGREVGKKTDVSSSKDFKYLRKHRARPPESFDAIDDGAERDWFTECKELHGNSCNGQHGHAVKMQIEHERKKRAV